MLLIRRDNQWSMGVRGLVLTVGRAWRHVHARWRRMHLWIGVIPCRWVMLCVGRHMAVDRRRVVVHVRWRRAHIGWRRGVMHIMLSPLLRRRRHGRLPMGHRRQMMVYHVQAGGVGCLARTKAMRNEKQATSNRLGASWSSRLRRHAARKAMNGWSVV
jgi:hypothetical protein